MAGRVIGRILSLGFPMPGPLVDNYNFLSAPSFFDYDAVVVDPSALSRLIEGVLDGSMEATTFGDAAVRNEPAAPGDVALGELLLRRREETGALLANGGVVVCFADSPLTHAGIAGAPPLDDYCWLPESVAGWCRPPALVPADGTQAHVVDYEHPLASFVHGQLANIGYRGRFEEARDVRVFVRSHGGAAIGVELPAEAGRVIMLPALRAPAPGDARYALSDAMQAGIRRALGVMAAGREPPWASQFAVPGLAEREAAFESARQARDEAQRALDEAESAREELGRYRRLLWQEGSVGLDAVVLDALRLIGFAVYDRDASALELRDGERALLLEIEASEHPLDLAPHHRLRQRIERAIESRGEAPRGLLVVNGRRLAPPGQRTPEVSDALRVAAETMRYCIAPSRTLFEAVVAQLSGDTEAVTAYRCRLFAHDGVLD